MKEAAVQLRFEPGQATTKEVQESLDAIFVELRDPTSEAAKEVVSLGVETSALRGAHAKVEEPEQGYAGVDILIQIGIPVATYVIEKIWDNVIWPRLQRKIGGDGLGERRKD